jgi:hypothetical protein
LVDRRLAGTNACLLSKTSIDPILQADLKQKDGRLRQLRAAIKALEGKLAELLQDKTDRWEAQKYTWG